MPLPGGLPAYSASDSLMAEGAGSQFLSIELVFASRDRQELLQLRLPPRSSVRRAIVQSGIAERFPEFDFAELQAGIWGRPVAQSHRLEDGDRVEIYRPLQIDPREARRKLAAEGRLMGSERKP